MQFTPTPPTTPGAYWLQRPNHSPELYSVECYEGTLVFPKDCLWSSRLVPVTEVEKAYLEGAHKGMYCHEHTSVGELFESSHAKQICDGKESGK